MIGVVKGSEIRRNRDGARNVLVLQVQCGDVDDVQSVEMMCAMGDDFHPPVGTRVEMTAIGSAYKIAVAGDDGIVPTTTAGERKIYSIAGGVPAAIAYMKSDGTFEINNGTGTAVEFGRLKKEFNQLKSDFDTHIHAAGMILDSVSGACSGNTAMIASASTADIDLAESDTVAIP